MNTTKVAQVCPEHGNEVCPIWGKAKKEWFHPCNAAFLKTHFLKDEDYDEEFDRGHQSQFENEREERK